LNHANPSLRISSNDTLECLFFLLALYSATFDISFHGLFSSISFNNGSKQ
jgi:hypothetical protein